MPNHRTPDLATHLGGHRLRLQAGPQRRTPSAYIDRTMGERPGQQCALVCFVGGELWGCGCDGFNEATEGR